jgi:non-canonical (house-cleaning) NTP pyrophosphatase
MALLQAVAATGSSNSNSNSNNTENKEDGTPTTTAGMPMLRVVLGSSSPLKKAAVQAAFAAVAQRSHGAFGIYYENSGSIACVKAPSGIDEQPVGRALTRTGALNRAAFTERADRKLDHKAAVKTCWIGLENGIFELMPGKRGWADAACIVARCSDGTRIEVWSDALTIDTDVANAAIRLRELKTIGDFYKHRGASKYGKQY